MVYCEVLGLVFFFGERGRLFMLLFVGCIWCWCFVIRVRSSW